MFLYTETKILRTTKEANYQNTGIILKICDMVIYMLLYWRFKWDVAASLTITVILKYFWKCTVSWATAITRYNNIRVSVSDEATGTAYITVACGLHLYSKDILIFSEWLLKINYNFFSHLSHRPLWILSMGPLGIRGFQVQNSLQDVPGLLSGVSLGPSKRGTWREFGNSQTLLYF